MNRRTLLKWISGALGAASAAVVAVPGGRFVADVLCSRRGERAIVKRVARLNDLVAGRPKSFPIVGSRRDAWTLYPEEVVGRVWLLRESDAASGNQQPSVTAFTAICPHLGCSVKVDSGNQRFVCPCHQAAFDLDGRPMREANGKESHAPRSMDRLECRLVRDADDGEWWVEVKYEKFEPGLTVKVAKA
jgi:menaquinol-cytochrome c reductase iron-sulfur subunit